MNNFLSISFNFANIAKKDIYLVMKKRELFGNSENFSRFTTVVYVFND